MHKRSKNCRDEQGTWDRGGGALEHGEQLEESVRREVKEEYGADVEKLQFLRYIDIHRKLVDGTPTHWINLLFAVKVNPKQAKNNEPYKIDEIGWFKPDKLPKPLHSQFMKELQISQATGIV